VSDAQPLSAQQAMTQQPLVEAFLHEDSHTWTYLVADEASGEAAIIDPVLDYDAPSARAATHSAERVLACARERGWRIAWILETHAHADHLSAGDWLRQSCGAPLGIGAGIVEVQRHFARLFDIEHELACDGAPFDRLLNDGDILRIGAIEGRAIATPGHTPDGMSYLFGDALFVGDTLFMPDSGTARCDFPGGDAATLHRSIERLLQLPDATRVFVCHDYGAGGREHRCQTRIADERHNIHLAGRDEGGFVALRNARDTSLPVPALLLPALQVNIRGGALPPPAANGVRYLRLPLDQLPG
jgi:glyoxylase-like metal-dependent hydrolase (beta-lactamase superfamily II)